MTLYYKKDVYLNIIEQFPDIKDDIETLVQDSQAIEKQSMFIKNNYTN